ncbi:MAG TPA: hypothetical protein VGN59_07810 [Acidimicrobiia bacterium]
MAAAAGLRLWGLGASRLSYDESFTAMAGRLPLGSLFAYLTQHDSHPPLDYLLHLPLARAGVSELWFRVPSVLCSVAAVGLFAWWLRARGRLAVLATALLAVNTFQVVHGRQARMYAELELLGVGIAVLASAWLVRPRRVHAVLLGVLVFAGLMTHTSMFLLGAGLLVLPGVRSDRAAWQWRSALLLAVASWAALWGAAFVTQAGGGHSAWIPRTTPATLVTALGSLLGAPPDFAIPALVLMLLGAVVLLRRRDGLGRVWICCFAVPVALAAVAGLFAPVVLDRTFTLMAWAPVLAVACLLDALIARRAWLGAPAAALVLVFALAPTIGALTSATGPNAPFRYLAAQVRPGDVVAVRPATKAPELQWSLGVSTGSSTGRVPVPTFSPSFGIRIGHATPTGRLWTFDWHARGTSSFPASNACHRHWTWGHVQIHCVDIAASTVSASPVRTGT